MTKLLNEFSLNIFKEGSGPIVVLSHALGCNLKMWDDVAQILKNDFTVVRYDHRNHGKSGLTSEPFSIDDLADDAAMLIKDLSKEPVFFVGLSLGGMVAQSLAARYPELIRACVIANSSQHYEESVKKMWSDRIERVKEGGVSAISEMAIERWFTSEYLLSENQSSKRKVADIKRELNAFDAHAYSLSCNAVAQVDCRKGNKMILAPTLVVFGTKDQATPPALSIAIHEHILGSELAEINAAHLSAVEKPIEFSDIVKNFLNNKS